MEIFVNIFMLIYSVSMVAYMILAGIRIGDKYVHDNSPPPILEAFIVLLLGFIPVVNTILLIIVFSIFLTMTFKQRKKSQRRKIDKII